MLFAEKVKANFRFSEGCALVEKRNQDNPETKKGGTISGITYKVARV